MGNPADENWRSDPRLLQMEREKLSLLLSFADELSAAPNQQKMSVFLKLNQQIKERNLFFSGEERDLLFQILTEHMNPEEKKKAGMIRRFSGQFPGC